jgi:hypothetical protein
MDKHKLTDWARNVYSQNGEDGIIEKILEIIGTKFKVAIEFGAWDGFHLSNTAHLWKSGWQGILIEGIKDRYEELKNNVSDFNCICVHAFVTREGENSLDEICKRIGIGPDVDMLSIDIDGDDYYIIESMNTLRPRVIVCEYNPTIPAEVDLYAEYGSYFGASVSAICRIAAAKGYSLVSVTETNCFFVQDADLPRFSEFETRLAHIKSDRQLVYLVTNYAGDYVTCGKPPYGISIPYSGKLFGTFNYFLGNGIIRGLQIRILRLLRRVRDTLFRG